MKTIRSITKNPLTIAVLVLAFLNLSCNQDDFVESYVDNSISNKYSGEEIFKSIIFADGLITEKIPSLINYAPHKINFTDSELIEYRKIQNNVIEYLRSLNNNYMEEFKTNILSKNHVQISNELNKSKNDLFNFFKKDLKKDNIDIENLVNEYQNGEIGGTIGEDGVAMWVVITVILVIGIVIAATLTKTKGEDPVGGPVIFAKQSSLSNEILVAEIANL